jgi:hypothetical protein
VGLGPDTHGNSFPSRRVSEWLCERLCVCACEFVHVILCVCESIPYLPRDPCFHVDVCACVRVGGCGCGCGCLESRDQLQQYALQHVYGNTSIRFPLSTLVTYR